MRDKSFLNLIAKIKYIEKSYKTWIKTEIKSQRSQNTKPSRYMTTRHANPQREKRVVTRESLSKVYDANHTNHWLE